MNRYTAWGLLVAFLFVVGLWPAALAPVVVVAAGADTVLAAMPGQVLLAVVVIAWLWLRHRPAPAKPARA
jgi:hypothetical protein